MLSRGLVVVSALLGSLGAQAPGDAVAGTQVVLSDTDRKARPNTPATPAFPTPKTALPLSASRPRVPVVVHSIALPALAAGDIVRAHGGLQATNDLILRNPRGRWPVKLRGLLVLATSATATSGKRLSSAGGGFVTTVRHHRDFALAGQDTVTPGEAGGGKFVNLVAWVEQCRSAEQAGCARHRRGVNLSRCGTFTSSEVLRPPTGGSFKGRECWVEVDEDKSQLSTVVLRPGSTQRPARIDVPGPAGPVPATRNLPIKCPGVNPGRTSAYVLPIGALQAGDAVDVAGVVQLVNRRGDRSTKLVSSTLSLRGTTPAGAAFGPLNISPTAGTNQNPGRGTVSGIEERSLAVQRSTLTKYALWNARVDLADAVLELNVNAQSTQRCPPPGVDVRIRDGGVLRAVVFHRKQAGTQEVDAIGDRVAPRVRVGAGPSRTFSVRVPASDRSRVLVAEAETLTSSTCRELRHVVRSRGLLASSRPATRAGSSATVFGTRSNEELNPDVGSVKSSWVGATLVPPGMVTYLNLSSSADTSGSDGCRTKRPAFEGREGRLSGLLIDLP